jgi:hypothetical protein
MDREQTQTQILQGLQNKVDDIYNLLTDQMTLPCPKENTIWGPVPNWNYVQMFRIPAFQNATMDLTLVMEIRNQSVYLIIKDPYGMCLYQKKISIKFQDE